MAVGGWAVTRRFIEAESQRLLSAMVTIAVDIPVAVPVSLHEDDDTSPETIPRLTEHEMLSVLHNWETLLSTDRTARQRLHEPAPGQIDMVQAIEIARQGVVFLHEQNILPLHILSFNDTRAYLGQNISQSETFLPIHYSFWNVRFVNDYMEISIRINAFTKQIWQFNIAINPMRSVHTFIEIYVSKTTLEEALVAFITMLGLCPYEDFIHEGHTTSSYNNEWPLVPGLIMFPAIAYIESQHPPVDMTGYRFAVNGYRFSDGGIAARIGAFGILAPDEVLHYNTLSIELTEFRTRPSSYVSQPPLVMPTW